MSSASGAAVTLTTDPATHPDAGISGRSRDLALLLVSVGAFGAGTCVLAALKRLATLRLLAGDPYAARLAERHQWLTVVDLGSATAIVVGLAVGWRLTRSRPRAALAVLAVTSLVAVLVLACPR